jgi:hypothetical protein
MGPMWSSILKKTSYLVRREKESLPDFYRWFLLLKAQALEVSNEQVIAQAIKALKVGPLHSHWVRERPKTMLKLYDQFAKFSKSEIQHFHKLEQQRKVAKLDEASRPCHNDKQQNYPKPVHNIDSDGHEPPKNWHKSYGGPLQERVPITFDQRSSQYNQWGGALNCGRGRGHGSYTPRPLYCMYHDNETNHRTINCPIYIDTKWKKGQESAQPTPQLPSGEANHTLQ